MKYNFKLWIKLNTISLAWILAGCIYIAIGMPYIAAPNYTNYLIAEFIESGFNALIVMNFVFVPAGLD